MSDKTGKGRIVDFLGHSAELELARIFYDHGFAVVIANDKYKVPMPDLVVITPYAVLVFEVKYRRSLDRSFGVPLSQLRKLLEFAERARCLAYLALKIGDRDWYVIPAETLYVRVGLRSRGEKTVHITRKRLEKYGLKLEVLLRTLRYAESRSETYITPVG